MKFGKSLSNQIEQTLPEWRDKFLSYKELKKRLKLIGSKSGDRPVKRLRLDSSFVSGDEYSAGMSKEEISFVQLLEDELEKFNNFFVEKEEEYIIRLKVILTSSNRFLLISLIWLQRSNLCLVKSGIPRSNCKGQRFDGEDDQDKEGDC